MHDIGTSRMVGPFLSFMCSEVYMMWIHPIPDYRCTSRMVGPFLSFMCCDRAVIRFEMSSCDCSPGLLWIVTLCLPGYNQTERQTKRRNRERCMYIQG